MTTVRRRILFTVAPLLGLIVLVGIAGIGLLDYLGRSSEAIIRDNYVSLKAMSELSLHLATIERAAALGEPSPPDAIAGAQKCVETELGNITIDGEAAAAAQLSDAVREIRASMRPADVIAAVARAQERRAAIAAMNEEAMYAADRAARDAARRSSRLLAGAVVVAITLAVIAGWWLQRTILEPIRVVTRAAREIGAGHWLQNVPVLSHDEVGRLAETFNSMAARLRAYRQADQDQLSRARRAAQATIDSFPNPVIVLDPAGRVELANPQATRLFGVIADTAQWIPPEPLRALLEEARRSRRPVGGDRLDDSLAISVAGVEHAFLPQACPIAAPDGETLGVALVLADVTRFRLLDRLKSDWVATVSHELKTPLTGMQLAVHVLLEEAVGPLESKQIELLLEARANADRLQGLIQQLLELAKLEDQGDSLNPRPTEIQSLISQVVGEAASRAEDRGVTLVSSGTADSISATIDAHQVGVALNNLVDNALRHTRAGGRVAVRAAIDGDQLRLTVEDTGDGIPASDLPRVFDRFYRGAGREDSQGSGLGLAIVREVAEAHGGAVSCASVVGEGTTMTLTLPVESSP